MATKATWMKVNVDGMSAGPKKAWDAMLAAREKFEEELAKALKKKGGLQDGEALKFTYNYGGLAIAVVDANETARKVVEV